MRTIVHLIRAILRKFKEWVKIALDKVPAWTQLSGRTGESIILLADRFHRRELQNPKAKDECMGIKVNIWNRAKNSRSHFGEIRCIQIYLDIFRYLERCISSFVPLIEWSFRMITQYLSGGGKGMKGCYALDCAMISRGFAGARLGRYTELCFLPDKAARFLFELEHLNLS